MGAGTWYVFSSAARCQWTMVSHIVDAQHKDPQMTPHLDVTWPSLETTAHQVEQSVAAADLIPAGSPINVAFVEDISIRKRIAALHTLSAAGLRVQPIVSSRRIASEPQLIALLKGITHEELIESVPIAESAIKLIGLSGFAKEHPIPPSTCCSTT